MNIGLNKNTFLAGIVWACGAGAALAPSQSQACAVCACGDPTLTSMGVEQPFAGRSRGAIEIAQRDLLSPEGGQDPETLFERTATFSYSYAPTNRLQFSVVLPLISREATYKNLSKIEVFAPGDVQLQSRTALWDKRVGSRRQILSASLGVKLPTGPQLEGEDGALLPSDLWVGTGSVDGIAGLSYGLFQDPFSAWIRIWAMVPSAGRGGLEQRPTALSSLAMQYQPKAWLSLQGTLDSRIGGALFWDGIQEEGTGGEALFTGLRALISPKEDLIIQGGISYPLYLSEVGEGPVFSMGVIHDF